MTGNTSFSKPWQKSVSAAAFGLASRPGYSASVPSCETYEGFSVLGGTSSKSLPRSERIKLIEFMMPAVRKLRLAALTLNELDAVIYLATGQQPSLCL